MVSHSGKDYGFKDLYTGFKADLVCSNLSCWIAIFKSCASIEDLQEVRELQSSKFSPHDKRIEAYKDIFFFLACSALVENFFIFRDLPQYLLLF